jgi:hypothetical protein
MARLKLASFASIRGVLTSGSPPEYPCLGAPSCSLLLQSSTSQMRIALQPFATLLLLAVAPASHGMAQEGMVPLELVQHLVPGMLLGEQGLPTVHVGIAPEPVSKALSLPAGARVLGSVVYALSSRTVVALPTPASAALGMMESELLSDGWTPPAVERQSGFMGSGGAYSNIYCRGSAERIHILPGRRADAEWVMTVLHSTDPRYSPCEARTRLPGSSISYPIPPLAPLLVRASTEAEPVAVEIMPMRAPQSGPIRSHPISWPTTRSSYWSTGGTRSLRAARRTTPYEPGRFRTTRDRNGMASFSPPPCVEIRSARSSC